MKNKSIDLSAKFKIIYACECDIYVIIRNSIEYKKKGRECKALSTLITQIKHKSS